MSSDPVDELSQALDTMGQVITAIGDDQWTATTVCTEWTVGDLVSHVVNGNDHFARILSGAPAAPPEDSLPSDDHLLSAYWASAGSLLEAFRQPDVLGQVFTVPIGPVPGIVALHLRIVEMLVHGWDLAVSTGQLVDFPEALAEQELAFTLSKLPDVPPDRSPFAPPQPVADGAPAIERLVACLGRSVTS